MSLKPWECGICLSTYKNPDRRPRTLPCGHTFCTPCLDTLQAQPVLSCPSCRTHHYLTPTDTLSINYDLEAVAHNITSMTGTEEAADKAVTNAPDQVKSKLNMTTSLSQEGKTDNVEICNQVGHNTNQEERTNDAKWEARCIKDRPLGISKKLKASLVEQQTRMKTSITACQDTLEQLGQFRSTLSIWKKEHDGLVQRLVTVVQQHQSSVHQLLKEDAKAAAMQQEGRAGIQQLTKMLDILDTISTPQEAFVASNNADCFCEDSEDWIQRSQEDFPDMKQAEVSAKVRAVTSAALYVVDKNTTEPLKIEDSDLNIMQKVQILTKYTERFPKEKKSMAHTEKDDGDHVSDIVPKSDSTQPNPKVSKVNKSVKKGGLLPNTTSLLSTPTSTSTSTQNVSSSATSTSTDNIPPKTTPATPSSSSESSVSDQTSAPNRTLPPSTDPVSIPSKISVEELRDPSEQVKQLVKTGKIYAVRNFDGQVISSKITMKKDRIYLHYLQDQPPPLVGCKLPIGEATRGMDLPDSSVAFLELSWGGQKRGTVHINLKPCTPLAKQFKLLCTGQLGHTYANTKFLTVGVKGEPGEYIIAGDYEHNDGTGGAHLLPNHHGRYRKSDSAGSVLGWYTLGGEKSAQFAIMTRDGLRRDGKKYINVFGQVESGMQALRLAAQYANINDVTIVDCGLVINE